MVYRIDCTSFTESFRDQFLIHKEVCQDSAGNNNIVEGSTRKSGTSKRASSDGDCVKNFAKTAVRLISMKKWGLLCGVTNVRNRDPEPAKGEVKNLQGQYRGLML